MGKTIRMSDIAKKLNISVVSVSKALAGKSGVSDEMRTKIITLARQMGYEGSRTHNESDNTGNIGVLVSDHFFADNTFYTSLYRSLVLSSTNKNLTCMVEIISQEAEQMKTLPALVTGQKIDGIAFIGNLKWDYLQAVIACGLPYVLLDFYIPGSDLDCVLSDNLEGGFLLTKHLLTQGWHNIGFVGSILSSANIMERYLGYQRALRLAGIIPREDWILEDRDKNGALMPLKLPEELPHAFVCSCDETAYHLIEMLERRGFHVPEDIAVCGYNDSRFALLCQPRLTTYQINTEKIAETAICRLAHNIRHEEVETMACTISGKLIIRESSIGKILG